MMAHKLEITKEQRKRLLSGTNNLQDLMNDARELVDIRYNTLCELEKLLYLLVDIGDFGKPEGNCWQCDYELIEEKADEVRSDD